ncbi:MAG: hypothetical protein IJD67_01060 [Clostridia bacterium]|nr:hypothetical protein [Clostridia bacterium]
MKPNVTCDLLRFILVLLTVVSAITLSTFYVLVAPYGELSLRLFAAAVSLFQFFALFAIYHPILKGRAQLSRGTALLILLTRAMTDLVFLGAAITKGRWFSISFLTRFDMLPEWYFLAFLILAVVFIVFSRKTFYAFGVLVVAYLAYLAYLNVGTMSWFIIAFSVTHLLWFVAWILTAAQTIPDESLTWNLAVKFFKYAFGVALEDDEDADKQK